MTHHDDYIRLIRCGVSVCNCRFQLKKLQRANFRVFLIYIFGWDVNFWSGGELMSESLWMKHERISVRWIAGLFECKFGSWLWLHGSVLWAKLNIWATNNGEFSFVCSDKVLRNEKNVLQPT